MKGTGAGRIERMAPRLALLTSYPRSWFRADSLAALSLWAVLVPQALAHAQIAGLRPVTGLYAALVSMMVIHHFYLRIEDAVEALRPLTPQAGQLISRLGPATGPRVAAARESPP